MKKYLLIFLILSSFIVCNPTDDLFQGIENLNVDSVKTAIENGADIQQKNSLGEIPLEVAIRRKSNNEIAGLLMDMGSELTYDIIKSAVKKDAIGVVEAYINKTDNIDFYEFLKIAAEFNSKEVLKLLISEGVDLKESNREIPLFCLAIQFNAIDVVEILIKNGFSVNDIYSVNYDKYTPLMLAAKNNAKEVTKLLIQKGANIKVKDEYDETLLMLAARNNAKEVVEMYIDKGLNIEEKNKNGDTLLMMAVNCNGKETVEFLINKGVNIEEKNKDGETALMNAVINNAKEMTELLIDKGANIEEKYENKETALTLSFNYGLIQLAKLLINKGADVNQSNDNGLTLLMRAVELQDKELVELMIKKGADLNAVNKEGKGLLSITTSKEIRKLLIRAGANMESENLYKEEIINKESIEKAIMNNDIESVKSLVKKIHLEKPNDFLINAIEREYEEIVDILLENKCYMESIDNEGNTPILFAAKYGNLTLLKKLIEKKPNLKAKNSKNENIFDIAASDENVETIKFLLNSEVELDENNEQSIVNYYAIKKYRDNGKDFYKILEGSKKQEIFDYAIRNNDKEILKLLLENGLIIKGFSAQYLMKAIKNNDLELVKLLLENKVDSEFYKGYYLSESPLYYAVENNNIKIVELLIKYGAHVDYYDDVPPIVLAVEKDYLDILKILLKFSNENINKIYFTHGAVKPIIYFATVEDSVNCVKYLLSLKPDLEEAFEGNTILNYAVANNSKKIIEFLFKNGYNVNSKSKYGSTPLMTAVYNENEEMINYLIDKGANLYEKDSKGKTALDKAKSTNIKKILLDKWKI